MKATHSVRWLAGLAGLMASIASAAQTVSLNSDTEVRLETIAPLTSKTSVKGDLVPLRTTADVIVDGKIIVPGGTPAVGQVSDARAKGALGMSGRLVIQPLYLTVQNTTIRLLGNTSNHGSVTAGAVIGMAVLTPGFTGRSATIPAGTPIIAYVAHTTEVTLP